ncbi:MAG: 2,3-bisphosphoglycerate-independent phosphoglycerate mutase, partial [Bacillota bacterium]
MPNRFALVILDGWGIGDNWGGNAILVAKTPNYNKILREYPNTSIGASGKDVGLPGREVGNSEVGHMNLGAGNVVEQDISLINKSIADGNFYKNEVILNAVQLSRKNNKKLHLIGIVSDGGVHSHINHLFALLKIAKDAGHTNVLIHAFTDGRDTPALKGLEFINKLEYVCSKLNTGKIASIIGRSYLDRKGNWRRTQVAYNAIVDGVGIKEDNSRSAISNAYRQGQTDEHIIPRIIDKNFQPMDSGDSVIFFNFRSDRTRQLTQSFLDRNFREFKRRYIPDLNFVTFIPYGVETELKSAAKPAFESVIIEKTLSSFIEENNLSQIHIAETEKFA